MALYSHLQLLPQPVCHKALNSHLQPETTGSSSTDVSQRHYCVSVWALSCFLPLMWGTTQVPCCTARAEKVRDGRLLIKCPNECRSNSGSSGRSRVGVKSTHHSLWQGKRWAWGYICHAWQDGMLSLERFEKSEVTNAPTGRERWQKVRLLCPLLFDNDLSAQHQGEKTQTVYGGWREGMIEAWRREQ